MTQCHSVKSICAGMTVHVGMKRRHSMTECDGSESDRYEVWKLKDVVIVEELQDDVQTGHVIKV